jgi:hypothetical protein
MPHLIFRTVLAALFCSALSATVSWAKPAPAAEAKPSRPAPARPEAPPRVDSAKVHTLYMEGEFDSAIAILEGNLKETRQYGHHDSVFIFKHLGVMYAAQFDTREKGKHYFHRLLSIEPTARIMDMYASDMIYMIYTNIQEEFAQSRMYRGIRRQSPLADSLPDTVAVRDGAGKGRPGGSRKSRGAGPWIWGGAAAVTVAAGIGAYFLLNEGDPRLVEKDYEY